MDHRNNASFVYPAHRLIILRDSLHETTERLLNHGSLVFIIISLGSCGLFHAKMWTMRVSNLLTTVDDETDDDSGDDEEDQGEEEEETNGPH